MLACWCLDGLHGNSQELNDDLFAFADTVHRVGTFRRKIEDVKTGLFVTFGSQEPASKTSGKSAVDKISQRGEIPLGDVLTPRAPGSIQGELCEDRKNQVPGSPLALTRGIT